MDEVTYSYESPRLSLLSSWQGRIKRVIYARKRKRHARKHKLGVASAKAYPNVREAPIHDEAR